MDTLESMYWLLEGESLWCHVAFSTISTTLGVQNESLFIVTQLQTITAKWNTNIKLDMMNNIHNIQTKNGIYLWDLLSQVWLAWISKWKDGNKTIRGIICLVDKGNVKSIHSLLNRTCCHPCDCISQQRYIALKNVQFTHNGKSDDSLAQVRLITQICHRNSIVFLPTSTWRANSIAGLQSSKKKLIRDWDFDKHCPEDGHSSGLPKTWPLMY